VSITVGIDLVRTSSVAASIAELGERYLQRIYTEGEVAYARAAPELMAARLAARFAAKEATMKALDLGERGVGWRDIEVVRGANGAPSIALHGGAALAAEARMLSVSLSHEGDYATAVVIAYGAIAPSGRM